MSENIAIENLIKKLWSREAIDALNSLRELGEKALPALIIALKEDDRNYETHEFENEYLRQAIKNVGEPAFQSLVKALQPESDMTRAAAKTLKRWGDKRAVEYLITAMLDKRVGVNGKSYIIDALADFRDIRAFNPLRDFIKSDTSQTKKWSDFLKRCAGCALAEYGEPDILPEIFDALNNVNPEYHTKEGVDQMIGTLRKRCIENGREMDFQDNWEKVKLSHPEMVKSYEESVEEIQMIRKNIRSTNEMERPEQSRACSLPDLRPDFAKVVQKHISVDEEIIACYETTGTKTDIGTSFESQIIPVYSAQIISRKQLILGWSSNGGPTVAKSIQLHNIVSISESGSGGFLGYWVTALAQEKLRLPCAFANPQMSQDFAQILKQAIEKEKNSVRV